ncbi:MAG: signal peptidase II [Gemmatimonadaceae bacterium]|nr:signal peptidase II [Gemmatimonadaceae bacterium]
MKALLAWPIVLVVVAVDVITKLMAESQLPPDGAPIPVVGNAFRLALVYNPGAAFGLYLGSYSRWIFMVLTIGALWILRKLYQQSAESDRLKVVAVAMVAAGALGNLIDRIRSDRGVVDFLDVGYGMHRWPTFNVADMAVSGGAFLLAWVLWREESEHANSV